MQNLYETIIIFNIDTDDYKESIIKFNKICQDFTGTEYEIDIDDIGIKEVATIQKMQGYYYQITWLGDLGDNSELDKLLRADDTVFKFLTIKITEDTEYSLKPIEHKEKPMTNNIVDVLDIIYGLT